MQAEWVRTHLFARLSGFTIDLKQSSGQGDKARSASRRQQATERAQSKSAKQRGNGTQVDVDAVAIEQGNVQQLGAIQDGDAVVVALVQELLTIVDAAGRRGSGATNVDAVTVQGGDVQ